MLLFRLLPNPALAPYLSIPSSGFAEFFWMYTWYREMDISFINSVCNDTSCQNAHVLYMLGTILSEQRSMLTHAVHMTTGKV